MTSSAVSSVITPPRRPGVDRYKSGCAADDGKQLIGVGHRKLEASILREGEQGAIARPAPSRFTLSSPRSRRNPLLPRFVLTALPDRRACLMANHGLVAVGTSLDAAVVLAAEVEELCAQYWRARLMGKPVLLSDAEMDEVLERFTRYGQRGNDRARSWRLTPGRTDRLELKQTIKATDWTAWLSAIADPHLSVVESFQCRPSGCLFPRGAQGNEQVFALPLSGLDECSAWDHCKVRVETWGRLRSDHRVELSCAGELSSCRATGAARLALLSGSPYCSYRYFSILVLR